jgi:hypothetical protein
MNKIYRRFGKTPAPLHLDDKEASTNCGCGNFIFVCSSCDMFASEVPVSWIKQVLAVCALENRHNNIFLFQTKNPRRFLEFADMIGENSILCATLESNRHFPEIMRNSPTPDERAHFMSSLAMAGFKTMVTIEPVMDFDLKDFLLMIDDIRPYQVNIGADSGNNHLPEPPPEKLRGLIAELEKFTKVYLKKNLGRILK